jgi:hypothetical protein
MRDPRLADSIAASLNDREEAGVKIAAITALGKVSNSAEFGERIFDRIDPAGSPTRGARGGVGLAEAALRQVDPTASCWRTSKSCARESARQLDVLRVLLARDQAARHRPMSPRLACTGSATPRRTMARYAEAIDAYRQAIAYFRAQPRHSRQRADRQWQPDEALLRRPSSTPRPLHSQQQQSRSARVSSTTWSSRRSRLEVERLIDFKISPTPAKLIDQAAQHAEPQQRAEEHFFEELSTTIETRLRQQNRTPYPPVIYRNAPVSLARLPHAS